MNNGRYLTLMDLGRADLVIRSGLWRAVLRHGWAPVVSAVKIRFRRESSSCSASGSRPASSPGARPTS